MAPRPALDLELLRTLVFIAEEASFTKAAERVGRTQSAVTLQVQKLEGLVGQTLVARAKGGPVELTQHGRALVENARAMLKINDDTLRALTANDAPATVKIGASITYLHCYLEETLDRFRAAHPQVLVEVTDGYSCQITPHVRDGKFDLVLTQSPHEPRGWPVTEVWRGPLRWITSETHATHLQDPVPLCLTPANCPWLPSWMEDCYWRNVAMNALKRAGRPYRIVASGVSMETLYAPVLAGRAITVTNGAQMPEGLRAVQENEGLPALPDDVLVMLKSRTAPQPYTDALADIVLSTFKFS